MSDSVQLGFPALERAAASRQADLARLVPIACELARALGSVTVSDIRKEAVRRGLLPATAKGRELSFLGALAKKAGLVPTAEWRRSEIPQSHGNLERAWRLGP